MIALSGWLLNGPAREVWAAMRRSGRKTAP
jgi:hypothetical protein